MISMIFLENILFQIIMAIGQQTATYRLILKDMEWVQLLEKQLATVGLIVKKEASIFL